MSAIPITTLTRMPIGMGCNSVARLINLPMPVIIALMPGPIQNDQPTDNDGDKGQHDDIHLGFAHQKAAISAPARDAKNAPTGPPSV